MAALAAAGAELALVRVALLHQGKDLMAATAAVVTVPLVAAERAQLAITVQRLVPLVEETVLLHQLRAHL
jgi:hypothetical protein